MSDACSRNKLLLVDSSSVAVGLFYALGGQKYLTADQIPFDELMDFITKVAETTLENITRKVKLDGYTAVRMAMESPPWRDVVRYTEYPDYKYATTKSDKPRIAKTLQGPMIEAALAVGVPTLFSPGWEADDVISIMVNKLEEEWLDENEVFIWSQDKDLHQLLTHPNIKMIGKGGDITTRDDAIAYWGHDVLAIPLLKAIVGDKSDNIPGIRGVGLKGAQGMIRAAPYNKIVPFIVDPTLVSESKRLEITQLIPRITKFMKLCKLQSQAPLFVGEVYFDTPDS